VEVWYNVNRDRGSRDRRQETGDEGEREKGMAVSGDQQTRGSGCRESERFALITRYSDNHCLVTRYPDAHYDYAKQSQFVIYTNERK